MKRILYLLLALAFCLVLSACDEPTAPPAVDPPGGEEEACTHTYGAWTTVTPASCEGEGKEIRTCSACKEEEERSIPATGHTEVRHAAKAPSCTVIGWEEFFTCSRCAWTTYAELPALSHEPDESWTITATEHYRVCTRSNCGTVIERSVHAYDDDKDVDCNVCQFTRDVNCKHRSVTLLEGYDATCEEDGLTDGSRCNDCSAPLQVQTVIPALGHNTRQYSEKAPTCTQAGHAAYEACTRCNYSTYEKKPALGHDEQHHAAKPPTATEGGWDAYVTCSRCDYSTFVARPATGSLGLAFKKNSDNKSYTVINMGSCTDADVVIPAKYEGLPVTAIGSNAFDGRSGLSTVTIPASVTEIGVQAFAHSSVREVTFAEGSQLKTIRYDAFFFCGSLSAIELPEGITTIGGRAFGSTDLRSIYIPGSVTDLGESTFMDCRNLSQVTFSENCRLERIQSSLFNSCRKLSGVKIPDTVIYIHSSAFSGCELIEEIAIPQGVISVGSSAFDKCTGLKRVYISDLATWCGISFNSKSANPLYYGADLYVSGEKLTEVVIPYGVTALKDYAFAGYKNAVNVRLPDSVTEIGDGAFRDCKNLVSVRMPNALYDLGRSAFEGCTALEEIYIPGTTKWIRVSVFSGCTSLKRVILGAGVGPIDMRVFYGCSSLTTLECMFDLGELALLCEESDESFAELVASLSPVLNATYVNPDY